MGSLQAGLYSRILADRKARVVKRGKLVWFGVYCIFAGLVAIALSQLMPAPAM